MKIVKLNGRFKQYRENQHTIALRFDGYTIEAGAYERVCRERMPGPGNGWLRHGQWYSYYGDRSNAYSTRPYWITFRNEQDLTLVLLSIKKEIA
jgi:hypothetical protein